MENVVCDLCGDTQFSLVYRVVDRNYGTPGKFSIVKCDRCELVYLNPRPSEPERPAIYPETQYDPFSAIRQVRNPSTLATIRQRAHQLVQKHPTGKVLDVGCADGAFLLALQSHGWKCIGVEPNPRMAKFAQQQGQLDVRNGEIFSVNDLNSFDLITFWDVLEHTPSPRAALLHASKLLVSHGQLALNLPNWSSLERHLFGKSWIAIDAPRHFYHFTPATIRHLLQDCAFEVESLTTHAPVLTLASNVLRLAGDLVWRRSFSSNAVPISSTSVPSLRRRMLIRALHWGLIPLNGAINLTNHGSNVTIFARKVA